ncbi:SHOCT domain-containing protein [Actinomadura fulvescens]|uniref:SHOCT domain-containing protein n=1 Tax=Actinomadura fulvescens TaxID=46160 RepID=A0ABP6CHU7_9ACTN
MSRRRGTPLLRGALTTSRAADAPVQISVRTASLADQLLQLGQLMQQGLLTEEEYAAAKADLLT